MPAILAAIPAVVALGSAAAGAVGAATSGGGGSGSNQLKKAGISPDPYQFTSGPDVSDLLQAHLAAGGQVDPGVMKALAAQAAGQGPSAAQAQLTQGSNQAMNQTAALAAQNHGNQNPGMAQRMALGAQANMGQQAGLNSAMLEAQTAGQAQGLYGQLAGQNAGLANQTSMYNAGQQNAMAGALAATDVQQNQFAQTGNYNAVNDLNHLRLNAQGQATDQSNKMFGGFMNMASSGAGAGAASKIDLSSLSDEDAKENVTDGDPDIEAFMSKLGKGPTTVDPKKFMSALKAHSYNYKPGMGEGSERTTSPMAQEVEQAAPGAVSQRQDGMKEVDYGKLQGNFAAALANLHGRLSKLEGDDEGEEA